MCVLMGSQTKVTIGGVMVIAFCIGLMNFWGYIQEPVSSKPIDTQMVKKIKHANGIWYKEVATN